MSGRDEGRKGRRVSRRDLLKAGLAGAAAGLLPGSFLLPALADSRANRLNFALVDHGAGPNPRPTALRRLAWEISRRTSIAAELDTAVIPLTDRRLFFHPFIVLAGEDAFPMPGEEAAANLRRHLTYGGTLLIDSTEGGDGSPFDTAVRSLVEQVLPGRPLVPIPRDHVLYKSFYLLEGPSGRVIRKPYLEGVFMDDRVALVYSQNDLLGAWARDDLGLWEHEVEQHQRERAFRLGVNVVMYSMCLDYKDDQVHIPFILKRRRS
ncbi:MAG: DUF4159 domain-containing protein [Myxococcota bacterium]